MTHEEFKMVLDALKGVADGTVTAVITYMVFYFTTPLLKTTILCCTLYAVVSKIFSSLKVTKVDKDKDKLKAA